MPLAVGNTWIYKYTILDSNNQVEEVSYDTLTVLKDTLINGDTFYAVSSGKYFRNDIWGLELYSQIYSTNKIRYMQFPTALNNSWVNFSVNYPDSISGNNDTLRLKYTTYSLDTLISVPKGNFNCIEYKQSLVDVNGNPSSLIEELMLEPVDIFYSKNIGVVKAVYMITLYESYRKKLYYELYDYTLF